MYFDQHEIRRATERHHQLRVEARILRIIRSSQQPDARASVTPPRRSLLARVFAYLREPSPAHHAALQRLAESRVVRTTDERSALWSSCGTVPAADGTRSS